jgi:RNA polymerase sigma-70 factor (ECF subfamily)
MSPSRPGPAENSRANSASSRGRAELDYLRTGRSQALSRFSKEYAGRILGWAIRLGPPEIDPQAIARTVFSEVLGGLDQQPEKLPAKVWIYRLTRRAVLDSASKSRKSKRTWMPWKRQTSQKPSATDPSESSARRRSIQKVLQALPLQEREVLILVDMEDYSLAEAGALIGIKAPKAASLLQEGRQRFAREAARRSLEAPSRRPSTGRNRK